MKTKLIFPILVAALASFSTGCKERSADHQDHAGHSHKQNSQAQTASTEVCTHGAPKAKCFLCDPALRDPKRLWCNEHARYEDRCWKCHPEAQDKNRLYCEEHGLYEDECFICHPDAAAQKQPSAADSHAHAGGDKLQCREHNVPEAECGICRPEEIGKLKPGQSLKVRLPSMESADITGISTSPAAEQSVTPKVECLAEITYNQNRYAQLSSPVAGIVQEAVAELGAQVQAQQVVARVWSAEIAQAVARAVLTHKTLDRERRLRAERVTAQKDLDEAEAGHRSACQQLRTLGFSEAQVEELAHKPEQSVLLEVRAPFAGEIVERSAVQGSMIEAGKPLFTLADRSTMSATLTIPETALSKVRQGSQVKLSVQSLDRSFSGVIRWISPEVDPRTRMALARAEIENPDRMLRARMFARAVIETGAPQASVVVPAEAVQWIDGTPVVFVKESEDLYLARRVREGVRMDQAWSVQEGLRAGEQVVVSRGFPLKSQLLLSRLGAGCADD